MTDNAPTHARPPAVRLERGSDGVATIIFDRPEVLNALDFAAMQQFADIVSDLGDALAAPDADVRVLILTGAGRDAFCSGGDVRALAEHRGATDGARLGRIMGDALWALERLPIPVIAAINGYALGGGTEIALACDLRVVAEDVRFGLVHASLALIPGWGAGQRLLRQIGYGRAMDMLLAARPYSAAELFELGVIQHIAPPGEALDRARALAEHVAGLDAATVRAVKGLLHDGCTLPYDEALTAERARFPGLWAADAHWHAVDRFLSRKR
ncbi:enoyl-CoA hydratase/isomerase family protein [Haliangium sp.]|uniref:enoyl-CoA hydratase/isomerase family protein n=1 Tax=Haliangium sp. TaxID=2663208 RepID=UPI003D0ABA7C